MRIAYIAPFQGPDLLAARPSMHNASLAARVKISLIAEMLKRNSHDVELFCQGEVDRYEFRFYPAFQERQGFDDEIPIFYASAIPVRFVNGFWASWRMLAMFKKRHLERPFDLVIIYNLKRPHITCAHYALKKLDIPVILEYEDDSFVDVRGAAFKGPLSGYHKQLHSAILREVSGCIGVSPYLLSQAAEGIPKLLLRGVVNSHIVRLTNQGEGARKNWVVFSGTHEGTQGLEQMVAAWIKLNLSGWELHIAGKGPITERLHALAGQCSSIVFRGLLNREENAQMLCSAKIGLNPQDVTKTPGNVFPFKVIEYLAAGLHVVSTPRGKLEAELERGVTYIQDNSPDAIAQAVAALIQQSRPLETAVEGALRTYGPNAVAGELDNLINQVMARQARSRGLKSAPPVGLSRTHDAGSAHP